MKYTCSNRMGRVEILRMCLREPRRGRFQGAQNEEKEGGEGSGWWGQTLAR